MSFLPRGWCSPLAAIYLGGKESSIPWTPPCLTCSLPFSWWSPTIHLPPTLPTSPIFPAPLLPPVNQMLFSSGVSSKPTMFPPFWHWSPSSQLLFPLATSVGVHRRKGRWGVTSLWTSPFLQFFYLINEAREALCLFWLGSIPRFNPSTGAIL